MLYLYIVKERQFFDMLKIQNGPVAKQVYASDLKSDGQ